MPLLVLLILQNQLVLLGEGTAWWQQPANQLILISI